MTTWLYWFPDRGEVEKDARKIASSDDPAKAAGDAAEKDWHRSDYWSDETIVVKNGNGEFKFDVEVESVPHFCVRRR